jgi:uncharacterized protein
MQNAILDSVMSPSELVCRLRDVSCYPHSVAGQVEVNETHISWILLAGHFAYKIKKPITTEFLDYGTLEKRHHACCEELRLNARYADGMYLDVVPITIEDDQIRMDGDALPIEFAVRMRRFPEGSLLSERLVSGQVSGSEINQLAKTVATIHHRAVADRGAMENKVASIHDQAMANFEYLQRDSLLLREDALRSIQEWTETTFLRLQKVFYLRIQEGFIRECHGDLHCDNVVFWHDHWVPFDGIEFNPKYSWIDVLSDIGFLVMDLEHGIEFHILNFDVDEATLRRRVTNRSLTRNDASDADLAVLELQLVEQEPLTEAELKLVDSSNCGPTYIS